MMKMVPVVSSNIESIGHDPETNTMHVKFKDKGTSVGKTYVHDNFPASEHARFIGADSPGSHYHQFIKGKYAARPL